LSRSSSFHILLSYTQASPQKTRLNLGWKNVSLFELCLHHHLTPRPRRKKRGSTWAGKTFRSSSSIFITISHPGLAAKNAAQPGLENVSLFELYFHTISDPGLRLLRKLDLG
jgi:hypothetical protein